MASFKFGASKKTYTIEGMEKVYTIDIGNLETMKLWREKLPPILAAVEGFQVGATEIDDLVGLIREIVNIIFDGDFEPLWELSGHNVYAMLGLLSDVANVIKESQTDIGKAYGL